MALIAYSASQPYSISTCLLPCMKFISVGLSFGVMDAARALFQLLAWAFRVTVRLKWGSMGMHKYLRAYVGVVTGGL